MLLVKQAARRYPRSVIVKLNGERSEVPDGASIEQLLEQLGLAGRRAAVELNGEIVRAQAWADTEIRENDVIEIVHFVGGG